MAILGRPLAPAGERARRWRRALGQAAFDPRRGYVGPAQTRRSPRLALRTRLSVLLRTYGGDYHTDAFDLDRLAARVREGTERIFFWGGDEEVATLREWLRRGHEPPQDEIDALALGTATVLRADELGEGYAEMCRTGSVCASVAAGPAILWDLRALLAGREARQALPFHTVASFPRNRVSVPGVRGGAAIHRIHVREIESAFWGVAPWHVMQGGALEVLDYREVYRRPARVAAALLALPPLHLADPGEAAYARALLRLNAPGTGVVARRRAATDGPARWAARPAVPEPLRPYNPLVVAPSARGRHRTPEAALDAAGAAGHACAAVCLPLDDPASPAVQARLRAAGFALSMLVPPRSHPSVPGVGRVVGVWSRPRPGLPLAPPYYASLTPQGEAEAEILVHLRQLLATWMPN